MWDMYLDIGLSSFGNYMTAFYSYDGSYWFAIATYKGNERYWRTVYAQSIVSGSVNLYLKFDFDSGNPASSGEGVFLDNIAIIGDLPTYPNLVPYQFNVMDDIIVTSSERGTFTRSTIYEGDSIYIDIGIANLGQATSFVTPVHLLIDNNLVFNLSYQPDLLPGEGVIHPDIAVTLDAGWHTIRMIVDSTNAVNEGTNEDDNDYEIDIYVEPATITFSGHLYYQDPIPPDTGLVPMKNVRIEMWDSDITFDDSLACDTTNDAGYFTLGPVDNNDPFSGTLDVYFKIYAENDACYVTDSYNSDETYKIETSPVDNIPNGQYDTTIIATFEQSGFFFVAENILRSYDKWFEITGLIPEHLRVVVPLDTVTAYDFSFPPRIIISRYDYYQRMYPDNFDASLIAEEYGHHLAFSYDFCDLCDTSGISTSWEILNTPSWSAMCESWTLFWSSYVLNNNIHHNWALDVDSNFTFYTYFDLENGGFGTKTSIDSSFSSVNNYGDSCIGSVTGILWDIYDEPDDDYSTFGNFESPYSQLSDGVWDTLTDGIGNILTTLLDRTIDGHHPDNITEFWQAWFQAPSFGHDQAMSDIWYEHGILNSCCVGMRGDINGDGIISVTDLTLLVVYMFQGGTISCLEEANVNCSDDTSGGFGINVTDALYLSAYMYEGGPAPCDCP